MKLNHMKKNQFLKIKKRLMKTYNSSRNHPMNHHRTFNPVNQKNSKTISIKVTRKKTKMNKIKRKL